MFYPYLSNIYTIDHYRYLVNGEILYILCYLYNGEIHNRLYSMLHVIFIRLQSNIGLCRQIIFRIHIRNFMEILHVEVALFHAVRETNGRTDTTTLTVAFLSCFATPPKNLHEERKASQSDNRRLGENNANIQAHKQTINSW